MSQPVRPSVHSIRSRATRVRESSKGTDLHLMRESNRLLILNCVREQDSLSRAEVARSTNLSGTTVGTIIDELIKDGLVHEGNSQRGTASSGRRIIPIHFNATAGYILAAAMGRNHVTLLLSDLATTIIKRSDIPFATSAGPDICIPQLITHIKAFVAEQHIPWSKFVGIGLATPGPLDATQQMLVSAPRMPGWESFPVRKILSAELQVPVHFDNNANLGALGESRYGAGRDSSDLLYVKVGTGIGSGLIINRQIYHGSSGSAGEIGHMTVDPQGPRCDCGNRGCLEVLAGTRAIVAEVRQYIPTIADMAQIIEKAQTGNTVCRDALEQAADYIGIALASLVNFFNPALIVLDGSTMQAEEILLPAIRLSVQKRSLSAPLAQTRIVPGTLKGSAIALGCVAIVLDAAFSPTASGTHF